ncbi:hypothetical protein BU26DRAFT_506474 [Trematosphaeria pertusa]|uniref:RING-type domain-containing protein n=1 Tax=Trematosphaeria pertusa TaxID=390896 RepID=A0A6A6I9G8_9PLEO|nr:uncharacterized protein BU26DRAFT_506474 [Trematosphaeria pertusa]KAF2247195.1 hypothetical protein BU26DRAFT_506474 [Trematosphaeria pertusa]
MRLPSRTEFVANLTFAALPPVLGNENISYQCRSCLLHFDLDNAIRADIACGHNHWCGACLCRLAVCDRREGANKCPDCGTVLWRRNARDGSAMPARGRRTDQSRGVSGAHDLGRSRLCDLVVDSRPLPRFPPRGQQDLSGAYSEHSLAVLSQASAGIFYMNPQPAYPGQQHRYVPRPDGAHHPYNDPRVVHNAPLHTRHQTATYNTRPAQGPLRYPVARQEAPLSATPYRHQRATIFTVSGQPAPQPPPSRYVPRRHDPVYDSAAPLVPVNRYCANLARIWRA